MNWWNLLATPIVAFYAFACGRNAFRWAIYTLIFGFFAIIPLLFLRKRPIKDLTIPDWFYALVRRFRIKRELKQINTPADLPKQ
ncbi:MAG: hypothetical protein KGP06_01165 [Acidobacteria bacterium]|nr:hypothetical protein [Acidobacteriota bacterium]